MPVEKNNHTYVKIITLLKNCIGEVNPEIIIGITVFAVFILFFSEVFL